jgi:hypothetical protein
MHLPVHRLAGRLGRAPALLTLTALYAWRRTIAACMLAHLLSDLTLQFILHAPSVAVWLFRSHQTDYSPDSVLCFTGVSSGETSRQFQIDAPARSRHARVLARFMEINGIARITHRCSDGIFRRARNLLGRQIQPRGNRARRVPNRATGASRRTLAVGHMGDTRSPPLALLSDPNGGWIVTSSSVAPRRSIPLAVLLAMPPRICV